MPELASGPSENAVIDKLLRHSQRRLYPRGSALVSAGRAAEHLGYIVEGSASVRMVNSNGNEIVLTYLNAGEFFGEMGLFRADHIRTAHIVARNECEVAEISYPRFQEMAENSPELMRLLLGQVSERLHRTSAKVYDFAFLDAEQRIAKVLQELAREPDAMTHPDGMQIRITRIEIGCIVGCSREMVGRVLKALAKRGDIQVKGKTMVIHGTR